MKKISRQNQKLIHWLIADYAKHLAGEVKAGEYWKYKAKVDLIKRYKKTQSDLENYVPFQYLNWEGTKTQEEARDLLIQELQMILLTNETAMSLSQQLMTNETAIKFTGFIFDFLFENEVEMRKEIIELYKQEQAAKFTIACIKNKKCCITGKSPADIHHVEKIQLRGYKRKDRYELLVLPLIREWHGLAHSKGDDYIIKKYNLTPVPEKLARGTYTDEEIENEIKKHKNPNKHNLK